MLTLSRKVDECKPCLEVDAGQRQAQVSHVWVLGPHARGFHSSTFRLNISAFWVSGGALWGCLGGF
jgi:hypothetical protein